MTDLANRYPHDTWGREARERARREAAARVNYSAALELQRNYSRSHYAVAARARANSWQCPCGNRNAPTRMWCLDCGEDRS